VRRSTRLLRLGSYLLAVFSLVVWVGALAGVAGVWAPDSYPKLDFFAFYAASSLALDGDAADAYDRRLLFEEEKKLPGDDTGYQPWRNPPHALFLVLPLSLLPVAGAMAAWGAATAVFALSAVRRFSRDQTVLFMSVAFPAVFLNLFVGQNGLVTAGLFGWGIALLPSRPVLAGAAFGALTYKPQFFPLVLLALLAARQRTAAAATAASAAVLALASLAVFGMDAWEGFLSTASRSADEVYSGQIHLGKVQSVTAVLLLAGVPDLVTQAMQAAVSLACAGFVVWLWRRSLALEYKASGLALATLLATPYSYPYDFTFLGLAVLWLGLKVAESRRRPWEVAALAASWAVPGLMPLVMSYGVPPGPFFAVALLAILAWRVRGQPLVVPRRVAPSELVV